MLTGAIDKDAYKERQQSNSQSLITDHYSNFCTVHKKATKCYTLTNLNEMYIYMLLLGVHRVFFYCGHEGSSDSRDLPLIH